MKIPQSLMGACLQDVCLEGRGEVQFLDIFVYMPLKNNRNNETKHSTTEKTTKNFKYTVYNQSDIRDVLQER